mmetsp:Transcript_100880/g.289547  ORF Transcript_100880/g.289547 Transcript_100880/m.289547 type:complete len:213 (-) Transcript_100880:644-1282(-)
MCRNSGGSRGGLQGFDPVVDHHEKLRGLLEDLVAQQGHGLRGQLRELRVQGGGNVLHQRSGARDVLLCLGDVQLLGGDGNRQPLHRRFEGRGPPGFQIGDSQGKLLVDVGNVVADGSGVPVRQQGGGTRGGRVRPSAQDRDRVVLALNEGRHGANCGLELPRQDLKPAALWTRRRRPHRRRRVLDMLMHKGEIVLKLVNGVGSAHHQLGVGM